MKKLVILVVVSASLVSAGIAVARGLDDAQGVKAVSGTFTATTVANTETRTCTAASGDTIAITKATYTGTASGDPDLTGNATLDVRSRIDTTKSIGVVNGRLKIDASAGNTEAELRSVYANGTVAGLLDGHAGTPHTRLLGNVSAGFNATAGFSNGQIGGTSGGSAVELTPGDCKPNSDRESSQAEGTVSAVSSTSITVAGLTCAVPSSLAASLNGINVGDRAQIRCSLTGGVVTLVKVGGKSH